MAASDYNEGREEANLWRTDVATIPSFLILSNFGYPSKNYVWVRRGIILWVKALPSPSWQPFLNVVLSQRTAESHRYQLTARVPRPWGSVRLKTAKDLTMGFMLARYQRHIFQLYLSVNRSRQAPISR